MISIHALEILAAVTERARQLETLISHANVMPDFLEKTVKLHALVIAVAAGGNTLLPVQLIFPASSNTSAINRMAVRIPVMLLTQTLQDSVHTKQRRRAYANAIARTIVKLQISVILMVLVLLKQIDLMEHHAILFPMAHV